MEGPFKIDVNNLVKFLGSKLYGQLSNIDAGNIEADVDLKDPNNPLYIYNNRVLSVGDIKNAKIIDYKK